MQESPDPARFWVNPRDYAAAGGRLASRFDGDSEWFISLNLPEFGLNSAVKFTSMGSFSKLLVSLSSAPWVKLPDGMITTVRCRYYL